MLPIVIPFFLLTMTFRTVILIASACDVWEDADVWRKAARQAYHTFHAEASRENDTATLEVCKVVDIEASID